MPDTLTDVLKRALKNQVLTLKDQDHGEVSCPTSWDEVRDFLAKKEFARLILPHKTRGLTYVRQLHIRGRSVSGSTPVVIKRAGQIEVIPIKCLFSQSELRDPSCTIKKIENTEIWNRDGWSKIGYVMRHPIEAPLNRVLAGGGMIEVTDDHSLFSSGKPVPTADLQVGDEIDLCALPEVEGQTFVDPNLAWVYGLVLAKGTRKGAGFEITSSDQTTHERIRKTASKLGLPYETQVLKASQSHWKLELKTWVGLDIIDLFSLEPSCPNRCIGCKIVPSIVFDWDAESQEAFLQGYLTGAGAVSSDAIEWVSPSPAVAQGILILASRVYGKRYPHLQVSCHEGLVKVSLPRQWSPKTEGNIMAIQRFQSHSKWVYDVETDTHDFMAGVGRIRAHNSVHEDFRFDLGRGRVWGFTITMPFGVSKETWERIEDEISKAARDVLGRTPRSWKDVPPSKLWDIRSKLPETEIRKWLESDLLERWIEDWLDWNNKHVCEAKALQDESWKRIEWRTFIPGGQGATSNEWGFMLAFDRGRFAFGVSKPDYREFFLESDRDLYTGRLNVLWLPRRKAIASLRDEEAKEKLGDKPWVGYLFTTREQQPYVLSQRSIESGFVPPPGVSCLPPPLEHLIPDDLRFWKGKDRRKKHEEAVAWAKEHLSWYERSTPDDWPESWQKMVRRKG